MKTVVSLRYAAREAHQATWVDQVFDLIDAEDRTKPRFSRITLELTAEQVSKLRAAMGKILIIEQEILHDSQADSNKDFLGP